MMNGLLTGGIGLKHATPLRLSAKLAFENDRFFVFSGNQLPGPIQTSSEGAGSPPPRHGCATTLKQRQTAAVAPLIRSRPPGRRTHSGFAIRARRSPSDDA